MKFKVFAQIKRIVLKYGTKVYIKPQLIQILSFGHLHTQVVCRCEAYNFISIGTGRKEALKQFRDRHKKKNYKLQMGTDHNISY